MTRLLILWWCIDIDRYLRQDAVAAMTVTKVTSHRWSKLKLTKRPQVLSLTGAAAARFSKYASNKWIWNVATRPTTAAAKPNRISTGKQQLVSYKSVDGGSARRSCGKLADGEFVRDPLDCTSFYTCFMGKMSEKTTCADGLAFDETIRVCNWRSSVSHWCAYNLYICILRMNSINAPFRIRSYAKEWERSCSMLIEGSVLSHCIWNRRTGDRRRKKRIIFKFE